MRYSLGELAVRFGCELRGDPATPIERVSTLLQAGEGSIAFLADARHRSELVGTRAAAVVLDRASAVHCPVAALITDNPRALHARLAALLHPPALPAPGIHPTAVVASDARIDPSAHVGPLACIGERCTVGKGAVVGPHCILAEGVVLEQAAQLVARVTLGRGVRIGARTVVHPGVVIGADGFGFAPEHGTWVKVPQLGSVRIGEDVEIGANTTIDRGAIGDTVIEEGVKLDNLIQVGHNVRIGAHTAIAACTGIAGSANIGRRVQIGGACGIGRVSICDDAVITGWSMISHSISRPGVYSSGIPFEEARTWRKLVARFKRLDSLTQRLAALERASGVSTASAPDEQRSKDDGEQEGQND